MNIIEYIQKVTGLSLNEIAEKLDIKYHTLYSYLRKPSRMNQRMLAKINDKFGISWAKIGEFIE